MSIQQGRDSDDGCVDHRRMLGPEVDIAFVMENGIEPVPALMDDVIYEGLIHVMAGPSGGGKTIVALMACVEVMRKGLPVLYFDSENGKMPIAQRLKDMGVDPRMVRELFTCRYPAEIDLSPDNLAALHEYVEELAPALVVFDPLIDFLVTADLEENSNTDCARWFMEVCRPLRDRGVATLVLDHAPKDGSGPRGASSKAGGANLVWELDPTQEFGPDRTGEISLKCVKRREVDPPKYVRFSVGGGVFARSSGTIEQKDPATGLTANESKMFDAVKKAGAAGARWTELERAVGSKSSASGARSALLNKRLIEHRGNRYYEVEVEPDPDGGPLDRTLPGQPRSGTGVAPPGALPEKGSNGTDPRGGDVNLFMNPGPDPGHAAGFEPESRIGMPYSDGSSWFKNSSLEPLEPGQSGGGSRGSLPFRGSEPLEPSEPSGSEPTEPEPKHNLPGFDFAPVSSGETPHKGSEEKEGVEGATGPANLSLGDGGSAPGFAPDGHDVVVGKPGPEIGGLLRDPPEWLARQLELCRKNPERLLNPTASTVAAEALGSAHRWREALPHVLDTLSRRTR